MTSSRLPEKPSDLFDLANDVVDALAENATFANLKTALELMTKLTAAMYAYGAYLAIEDGAASTNRPSLQLDRLKSPFVFEARSSLTSRYCADLPALVS